MNQLFTNLKYTINSNVIDVIECDVVLIEGTNNQQKQIIYDDLDIESKRKVDDFMQLIISLSNQS